MRRIREVLRLKHECALPNARIAAALGIAKGSVANYLTAATDAGLTHSEAQALDDAALNARLHPQRYVYPQFAVPDFGAIHRELPIPVVEIVAGRQGDFRRTQAGGSEVHSRRADLRRLR